MPRSLLRSLAAGAVLSAVTAGALLAQQDSTTRPASSRWQPFLGCWSTSSAGAIGPMVCVVPTDSVQRVEFLTVDGDSIIARTFLDASGRYQPHRRGGCQGLERGRWSSDSTRVYIQADYYCVGGTSLRSDAILDFTHADAFAFIEGSTATTRRVRTVNFIVQLDTTVYPAEVKRRLPTLQPLSATLTDLEAPVGTTTSLVKDFGAELPFFVLDAWMGNRGESAVFALADRDAQRNALKQRDKMARSLRLEPAGYLAWDANGRIGSQWTTFGSEYWGAEVPMGGYGLTTFAVGWGQPVGPLATFAPLPAGSVRFHWP